MRHLFALLCLPLMLAAAAKPSPGRDWSAVTRRLPNGAFVTGNPAARVKLIEYASYTCPHCAHFAAESDPILRERLIRRGKVSLEYRHLIRDGLDLSAAVVARCTGPAGFAATTRRLFAEQERWMAQANSYVQAHGSELAARQPLPRLRAIADGAGLSAIGQAQGLTPARLASCFADQAEVDRIIAMTAAVPKEVPGTPAFYLNGKIVPDAASWGALAPALAAAGAQ
jgi:protein-disulfide isomerase